MHCDDVVVREEIRPIKTVSVAKDGDTIHLCFMASSQQFTYVAHARRWSFLLPLCGCTALLIFVTRMCRKTAHHSQFKCQANNANRMKKLHDSRDGRRRLDTTTNTISTRSKPLMTWQNAVYVAVLAIVLCGSYAEAQACVSVRTSRLLSVSMFSTLDYITARTLCGATW